MWNGPYGEWGSRKYLLSSLDQSLKRLKLDYVDIFYSHRPDPNTPIEETMGALATAVSAGKALYVGLSNYNTSETQKALTILQQLGACLIHQPKYSMFVREPEEGLFDVLDANRVGCIPYSPLAQGLLTRSIPSEAYQKIQGCQSHGFLQKEEVSADKIERVLKLKSIADNRQQSISQLASPGYCDKNHYHCFDWRQQRGAAEPQSAKPYIIPFWWSGIGRHWGNPFIDILNSFDWPLLLHKLKQMNTHIANLTNAAVMIVMGSWPTCLLVNPSPTSLIPVFLGVILVVMSQGVKHEQKAQAHVAVMVTLLAFISLAVKPLPSAISKGESLPLFSRGLNGDYQCYCFVLFYPEFYQG